MTMTYFFKHKKRQNIDFIRFHLIAQILQLYRRKTKIIDKEGSWLYFEKPIDFELPVIKRLMPNHFELDESGNKKNHVDKYQINRIGKGFLYFKDEVLPLDWDAIDSKKLVQLFTEIKKNRVYAFREVDNKFYKTRVKDVFK